MNKNKNNFFFTNFGKLQILMKRKRDLGETEEIPNQIQLTKEVQQHAEFIQSKPKKPKLPEPKKELSKNEKRKLKQLEEKKKKIENRKKCFEIFS
jgi:hypothetical protein